MDANCREVATVIQNAAHVTNKTLPLGHDAGVPEFPKFPSVTEVVEFAVCFVTKTVELMVD
jgi:hypothetical protein